MLMDSDRRRDRDERSRGRGRDVGVPQSPAAQQQLERGSRDGSVRIFIPAAVDEQFGHRYQPAIVAANQRATRGAHAPVAEIRSRRTWSEEGSRPEEGELRNASRRRGDVNIPAQCGQRTERGVDGDGTGLDTPSKTSIGPRSRRVYGRGRGWPVVLGVASMEGDGVQPSAKCARRRPGREQHDQSDLRSRIGKAWYRALHVRRWASP